MLSAYLDGELDADERDAVEARLAESAEWRAELAERARGARRAAWACPAREAPDGLLGRACSRTSRPTIAVDGDDGASARPSRSTSAPSRVAARPGSRRSRRSSSALVAVIAGAAPQRGDAQRDRGRRAARRAGIRRR